MNKSGKLFCFLGCSGSGKSSIQHSLPLDYLVNYTTRPIRQGEKQGVHINKVDTNEFQRLLHDGHILEWTEYANNYYGTPAGVVPDMENGKSFHCTKDIHGIATLKEKLGEENVVSIYIHPPSLSETVRRMEERGDSQDSIHDRIRKIVDDEELYNSEHADYTIINSDLTTSQLEVHNIVLTELMK